MKTFVVKVRVRGEEVYIVEAETKEEALNTWFNFEPEYTDIFDSYVEDVETEMEG